MKIVETPLDGLVLIEPTVFGDARGYFYEMYHRRAYQNAGIDVEFVPDNRSASQQGVLRGLHFQKKNPQGKLVTALRGEVFDVAVDIRPNSSTFGQHYSVILSEDNKLQMYIPPGFAHGFAVLSDYAEFYYKCTTYYDPESESGISWNDETIAIDWPIKKPILSAKDKILSSFQDYKNMLENK